MSSFGGYMGSSSSYGGNAGVLADTPYTNMLNSPALSVSLKQNKMEHRRVIDGEYDQNIMGRLREDGYEYESRSGSDNFEGASGDDQDALVGAADEEGGARRRKKYHRHTTQQIQELESFFKECPHPDDRQRLELSRRLNLETKQVKFWFQNRRTQMKTQMERHENIILKQENDKLRLENVAIKDVMRNPLCNNCGGASVIGDISYEEHHLRMENARLKDELNRICTLADKFLGRPMSLFEGPFPPQGGPNSGLELAVGRNGFGGVDSMGPALSMGVDLGGGIPNVSPVMPLTRPAMGLGPEMQFERSMLFELALAAMDELVKKAQTNNPLWVKSLEGDKEVLNHEEYMRTFPPCIGMKPSNFVSEATRETNMVNINSLALVETLMDVNRWVEMFPCLIAFAATTDVISAGMNGTRNGALELMHAELQVLSPLVPARQVRFLRFSKLHADGIWAVVDVSIDSIGANAPTFYNCRRLPSGLVVQDMPDGRSKVTWVEHSEYDESAVHPLYRPLLSTGLGFGAQRWVATLERECDCLTILMSPTIPAEDRSVFTSPTGRRSMLKLAKRMMENFSSGICASSARKWDKFQAGNVGEDFRVMVRKNVDDPSVPPGIVLSAATSIWLPVTMQRVFDLLRDERMRSEWDILSNGVPMQEMAHIPKSQSHSANCVTLLCANVMNGNQNGMVILQETWTDPFSSLVVYAPVDIPAMTSVMNGGDYAYLAVLPSGFAIVPDGPPPGHSGSNDCNGTTSTKEGGSGGGGSLLTVGFQILVNSLPSAKLTMESVETVNSLVSCTIHRIKAALGCT